MAFNAILPNFWTSRTGRRINAEKDTAILATYLIAGPQAHISGLYRCPAAFMAHETSLSMSEVGAALKKLSELDFALFDPDTDTVLVLNMVAYQQNSRIPNTRKHIAKHYQATDPGPLKTKFYEMYGNLFNLAPPSKPHLEPERASDPTSIDVGEGWDETVEIGTLNKNCTTKHSLEYIDLRSTPTPTPTPHPSARVTEPLANPNGTVSMFSNPRVNPDKTEDDLRELYAHHAMRYAEYRESRGKPLLKTRPYSLVGGPADQIRLKLQAGLAVEDGKRLIDGLFRSPFHLGETKASRTPQLAIEYAFRENNFEKFTECADGLETEKSEFDASTLPDLDAYKAGSVSGVVSNLAAGMGF